MPLFPLNSVLCPKGRIPLQIFEPRYIDMISNCLKSSQGFVIVLLQEGSDTDRQVSFYSTGTTVFIQDFNQLPNGMLGITVEAAEKVAILSAAVTDTGLHAGAIKALDEEPYQLLPGCFDDLVGLLKRLMMYPAVSELSMDVDWLDARHIGWRLTELLPVSKSDKQRLLEMNDAVARLRQIDQLLDLLEG